MSHVLAARWHDHDVKHYKDFVVGSGFSLEILGDFLQFFGIAWGRLNGGIHDRTAFVNRMRDVLNGLGTVQFEIGLHRSNNVVRCSMPDCNCHVSHSFIDRLCLCGWWQQRIELPEVETQHRLHANKRGFQSLLSFKATPLKTGLLKPFDDLGIEASSGLVSSLVNFLVQVGGRAALCGCSRLEPYGEFYPPASKWC